MNLPPFIIGGGSNVDDIIAQIQEQDAGWERVTCSLAKFLARAFPHAQQEAGELGAAILALMTTGSARQIEKLRTTRRNSPASRPYTRRMEILAKMVEERDRLTHQLETAEKGITALRDNEATIGMADIMEASAVMPIRNMLAGIEEQISRYQAQMEKRQGPAALGG